MEPHAAPELPPVCEPTGHLEDLVSPRPINSEWTRFQLARLNNDPELQPKWTRMLDYPLPSAWGIKLKFKIEAEQPSGSHKHRLAKALYVHALANGWIKDPPSIGGKPVVVEASSGSTAISEAWYAQRLGIDFTAVVPKSTSSEKVKAIEDLGGKVMRVDPEKIYDEAKKIAEDNHGHYMDQFTYAERAYDWRGGGLAKEVFEQVEEGPPTWFVMGGGTGGTAAVFSRYARAHNKTTKLCMPDPEGSAFFCGWRDNDILMTGKGSLIEGIGRPRIEPSFIFDTVDHMMQVPNAASLAAMTVLSEISGFPLPGGSSGTHFLSALKIIADMLRDKQTGIVVTVLCDSGDRYKDSYYNPDWYKIHNIDIGPWKTTITDFLKSGTWKEPTTPVPPSTYPYPTIWDNV